MKRAFSAAAILLLVLGTVFTAHALYDQIATGTWGSAGAMAEARSGAAAVRLDDGRLLFTGGSGANGALNSAEILTAGSGFSSIAPMAEARSRHTATKLSDGRVLVVGGDNGTGATITAELYDASSKSWSSAGSLSTARSGHTASLLQDGRVLIVGGENSGGPVSLLEIFDPSNNSFSNAGTLQRARSGHAAAVLSDGRVLIVGGTSVGQDGNPVTVSSVEIYDPADGSVNNAASLSTARSGHSATTLLDGTVFVMGGNDGSQDLASAEIYDASANTWTPVASNAAAARSGHAAFLLPNNANVLIAGGASAGSDLASAELYEPWSGQFKATGSLAAAHPGVSGGAVGSEGFLAVAGESSQLAGEIYHFATIKTDAADYPPGTQVLMTGSGWMPGETVTLSLLEEPLIDTHPDMTAVADANGDIRFDQWAPDDHDLNVGFVLTAKGSQSQAQTKFMDSVANVTITSVSPVATITTLPTTVTVNFNYSTSTTGTTTGQLDITGTVISATKSLTPGVGLSDSISVNVPAGTPNGTYNAKVTVTNLTGTGANQKNDSATGAVVINVPTCVVPAITMQPTAQSVNYGNDASFSAAASGTPAPTVQWQVNTGAGFTNLSGQTSPTLNLTKPAVTASGNLYRAVFTNTCGGTQTATSNSATLTVTPATLTYTADPKSREYGAADPAFTGTVTGFVPTETQATATAGTLVFTTTANTTSSVGSYPINGSGLTANNGNYVFVQAGANATALTVTAKAATWTTDPVSKTYGDADPTPLTTGTGTGFLASDGVTATYSRASGESVLGGPYHITATLSATGALSNYTITNAGASFTINPRPATWTTNANSKTYGDSDPTPLTTGSGSNFVDAVSATYSRASGESVAGSPYHITATLTAAAGVLDNYNVTNTGADFTINARSITVTPEAGQHKTYGDSDPALSFTVGGGGLAFSDTIASVFTGNLGRAPGENVGDSGITQGTLAANSNYTITSFTAGITFHISPAPLSITPDGGKMKTYGDVFSAFTGNVVGLKFSDAVIVAYASTGASAAAGVGAYNITVSSYTFTPGTASNYAITTNTALSGLTVNPAPLSITPDGAKTKVLGSVFTAFTGSVVGLRNSDAVTVNYASAGAPAGAGVGSYDITVGSYNFTVGSATNYSITLNSAHNGLTVLYSTGSCLGSPGHQILQPINPDGSSVFKQGSTAPAKFRVCDANGNSIGTAGVVSNFHIVQIVSGTVVSTVDETVDSTTPDNIFRWSPTDQQWIYNVSTKSFGKNQTYYFEIKLNDGSSIFFNFGLK
jgi:hypothetical protein